MANISVTNALNDNSATSDITKVGTNFTDLVSGLTDGTKDIAVSKVTVGGGSQITKFDFGTYTPTLTKTTNVDTCTEYEMPWVRIGNNVIVGFKVDIDPLSATTTPTVLTFTLPIACASTPMCFGSANCFSVLQSGTIRATSATAAKLDFVAISVSSIEWEGVFIYVVN